jgi:hypothetical protein
MTDDLDLVSIIRTGLEWHAYMLQLWGRASLSIITEMLGFRRGIAVWPMV